MTNPEDEVKNKNIEVIYFILLSCFGILFVGSLIKTIYNYRLFPVSENAKLLVVDGLACLLSLCIAYIVRIIWCCYMFGSYSYLYYSLLDSLCQATQNVISASFVYLWTELYLNINFALSEDYKTCLWKTWSAVFFVFVCTTYVLHISFALTNVFGPDRTESDQYLNVSIAGVVIFITMASGFYCLRFIRIVYCEKIASSICRRLRVIIVAISIIYAIRAALCIINLTWFHTYSINNTARCIFLSLYYIGTEIMPLLGIILYFRIEIDSSGYSVCIPSLLQGSEKMQNMSSRRLFCIEGNSFYKIHNKFGRDTFAGLMGETKNEDEDKEMMIKSLLLNRSDI